MLKNILNLEGALELTKSEQKTINGGITPWMAEHCIPKQKVNGVYVCDPSTVYIMGGWCCDEFPS